MPTEFDPIVDNWYRHLDKGQKFKVVAIDDVEGAVEIQHFDGDVEEVDLDEWSLLDLELIEEPGDWTGPLDVIETDDLGYTDTGMPSEDGTTSLREINPGSDKPPEEESGELEDDWGEGFPQEEPLEGKE